VLIPVEAESTKTGLGVFERKIPVPMVIPGENYGRTNSKRPWLFLEA
jgi:hypothetical protein